MKFEVLLSSLIVQMKQSFSRPMFRFCLVINPILNTILLYEMYRSSNVENFIAYVVLGAGLMGMWGCICFSSAGDINRERYNGTLSLIFIAPADFKLVLIGKILGNTLISLLTLVISILTAIVFYHTPLLISNLLAFMISLCLTVLTFTIISFLIASILTLSRKTELYMNLIEIPIVLLSGFVFPITILPHGIRVVSYSLSPTYAIELLRMSVWGIDNYKNFYINMGVLILLSCIYWVASLVLYKKIESRVRIDATLEVV